jgi:methanogenic corrinoid protein MtbC1
MDRLNLTAATPGRLDDCESVSEIVAERFDLGIGGDGLDLAGTPQDQPSPQERMARIVHTIESEIIPRLVQAYRGGAPDDGFGAGGAAVAADLATDVPRLARMLVADGDRAWTALVDERIAAGVPVDEICLQLLAPAARELGRMWDEDECSFSDVTVGVGRLQRLMRAIGPALCTTETVPALTRRVLLIAAPDEAHTFGLSMVSEFFRRAGWDVAGLGERQQAADALGREWFDLIGVSIGAASRLDWLRTTIGTWRGASVNPDLLVMVGGPGVGAQPEAAHALGADAIASDGRQAPVLAEQLLARRAGRVLAAAAR